MDNTIKFPIQFTEAAVNKVKSLISKKNNQDMKLRIYISGGGCNGFQYKFVLDDQEINGDIVIRKKGASLVIDPMSFQYLIGGSVDYIEKLESARFIVINPNAKNTCGCGFSFSI